MKYFSDIFSETVGPIFTAFHVKSSVKGGLRMVCSDGRALLIKIGVTSIYGKKTLKNGPRQNQESYKAESWYIKTETGGSRYDLVKGQPRTQFHNLR